MSDVYSINELKTYFNISRSLIYRHLDHLQREGWARRCTPNGQPGTGSSPWLISELAVPYLRNQVGKVGRPRIHFNFTRKCQGLGAWHRDGTIASVARALGTCDSTARRFLEREGVLDKKKGKKKKPVSGTSDTAPVL